MPVHNCLDPGEDAVKSKTEPEVCVVQAPVDDVKVGGRVRKDLGDVESLAQSMAEHGQIEPIVISPDFRLVCGERRLTAARLLGWTTISAIVQDYADELAVEVQENAVRLQMTPEEIGSFAVQHWDDPEINGEGARRDLLGKMVGCSGVHLERCKRIVEAAAEPENKDLLQVANEKGAKRAETLLKRRERTSQDVEVVALETCEAGDLEVDGDVDLLISTPRYSGWSPDYSEPLAGDHLIGKWLVAIAPETLGGLAEMPEVMEPSGVVVCAGKDGRSMVFVAFSETKEEREDHTFIGPDLVDAVSQAIQFFTEPGQLVVHVDMEDATVASACTGRRFIGCDMDYQVVEKVKETLGGRS